MISFIDLSKRYTETPVLDRLNLTLNDSGLYLLFGESGSGKTTFLNILAGQLPFEKGQVVFEGSVYEGIVPETFSKQAEYLTQDAFFVDFLTVLDNLRLLGAEDDVIGEHLQLVGLSDKGDSFPTTLSGGERQRLMLARALLKGKKVLLLDEPTAALDKENKEHVFVLLKELSKRILIVMASHDPRASEYADQTILFSKTEKTVQIVQGVPNPGSASEDAEPLFPEQRKDLIQKPASGFLKKWFRFSGRERASAVRFMIFMALAMLSCMLADTPAHKNKATMAYLYRLNCLELIVQGNYEMEDLIPADSGIREKVISYDSSVPVPLIRGERGNYKLPSYETNLNVLPDVESLCMLSNRIAYGTYFTGPDQVILSMQMAEKMMPNSPESLIGKTIERELYGRGKIPLEIVGIFKPSSDVDRIYLYNCGSQVRYGSYYHDDSDDRTYFVSASTLDPLVQDASFYSESGGRQRGWYLYFNSYFDMERFYQKYRESLNRVLGNGDGRVMLIQEGIPLEYSTKWPLISWVLLPVAVLVVLLTVLFFANMKHTELAYNNRFIAVFEYAGYSKKTVIRSLAFLSLREFIIELAAATGAAFILSVIGNIVNNTFHFIPISLFTYNPLILGGVILTESLVAYLYLYHSLSRVQTKGWYELLRETRDLL